jgi:hypothetical protein
VGYPPAEKKHDSMEEIRKRLRDIYAEIEAIDKTINIKQTTRSDFSIEGDIVKSMQFLPEDHSIDRKPQYDPSILAALKNGAHFSLSGTCSIDEKTIEKLKKLNNTEGIRFVLDVASIDEYMIVKKGNKITYMLTFDENALPANTSDAAGLIGLSTMCDRWNYDSVTVQITKEGFHAKLTNLRKKN